MNIDHLQETMDYMKKVKMVFMDHHDNMGLSSEESEDIYNSSSFYAVEKWLIKQGYDIQRYGDEL
ncbi:hypothetical protein BED47_00855 [Gottfriedia luciferensis]|uniref:Uncharacterized protein n=1 Tax=Gottfriedia luciferensis TaxID=178774 RepID=A0ABX2ZVI7_9BACI|nr:hypothetical protein [Gottfriedia luciferensis]ODG93750.1 hypothetical protein BED47_00855 [Gottfriedia luciferensis]